MKHTDATGHDAVNFASRRGATAQTDLGGTATSLGLEHGLSGEKNASRSGQEKSPTLTIDTESEPGSWRKALHGRTVETVGNDVSRKPDARLAGNERDTLRRLIDEYRFGKTAVVPCVILDAVLNAFDKVEAERDTWKAEAESAILSLDAAKRNGERARTDNATLRRERDEARSSLDMLRNGFDEAVRVNADLRGLVKERDALIDEALPACRFVHEVASLEGDAMIAHCSPELRDAARTLNGGFVPVEELREALADVTRERDFLSKECNDTFAQAKAALCSLVGEEHFERIPHEVVQDVCAHFERGERYAPRYTEEQRLNAAGVISKLAISRHGSGDTLGNRCLAYVDAAAEALGMRRAGA